ncbi:MAG: type II secretion system protein [Bacilli bacterium]|nr:type II secretion system protein [Bacilli bacterium]
MNKKAFTLIELLGVVTILSMLGLIIVPVTTNIIRENKEKLYETQIRNIKQATSNFVSENFLKLNIENGQKLGITLGKLKELGHIDTEIKNPITKEKFEDNLVIIISKNEKGYEYTVCTSNTHCDTNINMY